MDERGGGWWEFVTRFTLEVEGSEKPCFVGDSVVRVMAPAAWSVQRQGDQQPQAFWCL